MDNNTTKANSSLSIFDKDPSLKTFKKSRHLNYNSSRYDKYSNKFLCKNCGEEGHLHKYCRKPIISLGIILFKCDDKLINYNKSTLKFLLIRRKDSIGFVEFIRGKYALNDISYIQNLFDTMSIYEKERILNDSFCFLWKLLWMENDNSMEHNKMGHHKYYAKNNYDISKKKFEKIKNGYDFRGNKYDVKYFITHSTTNWTETEWGFPKGRRNLKESDIDAAKREFTEETGIQTDQFTIITKDKVFIEQYKGSDNVIYKHIYYLATYNGDEKDTIELDPSNRHQITEISKLGFYNLEDSLDKIRDYHKEKKKILQQVYQYICDKERFKWGYGFNYLN